LQTFSYFARKKNNLNERNEMETPNDKAWSLKNIIITLFTIEQLLIIYIIASKKGIAIIDWFNNLF